jgi:hypothetical protein
MTQEKQYPNKPAPIPDDAPKDWPLTAEEAGDARPANRDAYKDMDRARYESFGKTPDDPDPEPDHRG